MKKRTLTLLALTSTLLLAACQNNDTSSSTSGQSSSQAESVDMSSSQSSEMTSGDHGEHMDMAMMHNRNEEVPTNMEDATNAQYPVGSTVRVTDNAHMDIMSGVEAEVTGAYDTTLYTVTFTTADNNQTMEDHKWVVAEEVETADGSDPKVGDKVVLHAEHMAGMAGQEAEITGEQAGPAYMISFQPSDDSEPFTNHKWVSEDEISAIEE